MYQFENTGAVERDLLEMMQYLTAVLGDKTMSTNDWNAALLEELMELQRLTNSAVDHMEREVSHCGISDYWKNHLQKMGEWCVAMAYTNEDYEMPYLDRLTALVIKQCDSFMSADDIFTLDETEVKTIHNIIVQMHSVLIQQESGKVYDWDSTEPRDHYNAIMAHIIGCIFNAVKIATRVKVTRYAHASLALNLRIVLKHSINARYGISASGKGCRVDMDPSVIDVLSNDKALKEAAADV